jgi:hypothetical protein
MLEYKLIFAAEVDLFEERLNRFILDQAGKAQVGDPKFSTCAGPNGTIMFSALVPFKRIVATAG